MAKTILVTGGAGYIGSACVKDLCEQGHTVVVYDNLSKGDTKYVDDRATFVEGDVLDRELLEKVFAEHAPQVVIHTAALKAVGESEEQPARYFRNNVVGTLNVLEVAAQQGIEQFIFSSTAAVYDADKGEVFGEDDPLGSANVYGHTKRMAERMIKEFFRTKQIPSFAIFRYFNVAGDVGLGFAEDNPQNIFPIVARAIESGEEFSIFGNDYETADGTCVRDYIHLADIVSAHVKAIEKEACGIFNLGTNSGSSVQEIVAMFEKVSGTKIQSKVTGRRAGDPALLCANADKAKKELGWQPRHSLEDMVSSTLQK